MVEVKAPTPTAERLIRVLKPLTPFAEAIVTRQVQRAGLQLDTLHVEHMDRVGPMIIAAAKVFLDPAQLDALKRAIA